VHDALIMNQQMVHTEIGHRFNLHYMEMTLSHRLLFLEWHISYPDGRSTVQRYKA